jgi:hypothetical protein
MKFKILANYARRLQRKLDRYVSVEVCAHCFNHSNESEIKYCLYIEGGCHQYFDTAQQLHQAMKEIMNPPKIKTTPDQGVEV